MGVLTEQDLRKCSNFPLHYCQIMAFSPQVLDSTAASSSSVDGLQAAVNNTVSQLKKQGVLSAETMGQIFNSVSNKLNGESDQSKKADRQKVNILSDFRYRLLKLVLTLFWTTKTSS